MNETIEVLGYKSFIEAIEPFEQLQTDELERVIATTDVLYFKENQTIIKQNDAPKYFYIIIKGKVELLDENDIGVNYLVKKDYFDSASLMDNVSKYTFNVLEESICFAFPKDVFLSLLISNNSFKKYFIKDLSEKVRTSITKDVNKELASFMVKKVKESLIRKAVIVDEAASVYETVKAMTEQKSSSALVLNKNQSIPSAIVTDTDLREKVILQNASYDIPIKEIATNSLITIDEDDFLFNGMVLMIQHSIKRLIVTSHGKAWGVLEQIDLLGSLSHKSHLIDARILRASNLDELKTITDDMTYLIKSLMATGVNISKIQSLLGELNVKLYKKLYELVAPPELIENSCIMLLGSEGRKEQVLKTDQDNAIILKDAYEHKDFRQICNKFTKSLIFLGYPECPGNVMVKNPYWAKSLKDFKTECTRWINEPTSDNLMNLSILFDARVACGDESLLKELKSILLEKMNKNKVLMARFSMPTVMFETPLSFLFGFIVGKNKEYKGKLDLKRGGIFPIVHGIRSLALERGITNTNTLERIALLTDMGVLKNELSVELTQAFDFLTTLRARIRIKKQDKQLAIDNYVNPYKLNKIERDILKDVFKIVDAFKKLISTHFSLDMIK